MTGISSAARPVTVITGASAGIGSALARCFAADGHDLVLVARRKERLTALAYELTRDHGVSVDVIALDLGAADAGNRLADELAAAGCEPRDIVNNAGFGLVGPAIERDRQEELAMIDLNCRLLTDLSLRFADSLARHKGGILNVASVAGFLPGPQMAVYYATKAYVLSFSEALHCELAPRGIRVTALCPGPTPTEFQERAGVAGHKGPRLLTMSAEDVARAGYEGYRAGKRLIIPGFANKIVPFLVRFLPRSMVLMLTGGRQSRLRRVASR